MRNLRNNKGITLIALVVTIIVLLILAGVGISMLTGENSIIRKAIDAKEATNEAEAKERVQLEVLGSLDNKGNLDKDKLKDNLRDNLGVQDNQIIDPNEGDEFENPFDFPLGDFDIEVKPDGQVEVLPKGEVPTPPTLSEGDITYTVTPSTLTNKEVKVTIKVSTSVSSMRLTLQYATEEPDEETSWQTYSGAITFKDNGPIYARLINENGEKNNYTTGNVTNIDKVNPTITEFKAVEGTTTTNGVQVTVTASDDRQLASKDTYKFFAKEEGTEEYKLNGTSTESSYTYTNLTPSKNYELKVIVTDEAGNTSEQTIESVEMAMPELNTGEKTAPSPGETEGPTEAPTPTEGATQSPTPSDPHKANITFNYSYTEWNNMKSVNVTIKLSEDLSSIDTLKLQYQTPNEENKEWQDYQEGGFQIKNNGSVFARLVKKEGSGESNTATSTYSKFDREVPEVSEVAITNFTTNSISVEVTATDKPDQGASGLADENAYIYMIDTTANMSKVSTDTMIMGEPMGASETLVTESSNENTHTFTGLTHGTDYTIRVLVQDKAQNIGEKEEPTTQTTEKIPDLSQEGAITFDITPDEWNNKDEATVRITTTPEIDETKFKLQYQTPAETSGEEWLDYDKENGFKITNNGSIFARVIEKDVEKPQAGITATRNYNFFDRKLPTISIEAEEAGIDSVKVNVTDFKDEPTSEEANDASGLLDENKFIYYMEEVGGSGETSLLSTDETSHIYTGLTQGKEYIFKVTTQDKAGNIGEAKTETITTKSVPDLNLEGAIDVRYIPQSWTNTSVKVTATSKHTAEGYILQYAIDKEAEDNGGITTWRDVPEAGFDMEDNGTFKLRLKYQAETPQYGTPIEKEVTWIDRIAPTVNILNEESTTNSIKVNISAADSDSGLDEEVGQPYKYYIVEGSITDPEQIQAKLQEEQVKETTNQKEYTYTELQQGTEYTVIVTATDRALNTTTATKVISTKRIPDLNVGEGLEQQGNITFNYSKTEWNNDENVTVTITLSEELKAGVSTEQGGTAESSEFKLQYAVVQNKAEEDEATPSPEATSSTEPTASTEPEESVELEWQDYESAGFTITQNGSVYARLIETNGTQTSGTATSNYNFFDREAPTVNEITDEDLEITDTSIKVTVHATDEESGIKEYAYYLDGEETENLKATQPAQETNANEDTYMFDGLEKNSKHTIIVKVKDKATNEEKTEIKVSYLVNLKIGKYVKYEPDENTEGYSSSLEMNGYEQRTAMQEELNWQILKVGTGDNGLEEGIVKIISTPTTTEYHYKGANGYNNGVKDLNDMCETLYSHGTTKARSVNMDDFEDDYNGGQWKTTRSKYTRYGEICSPTTKQYPNIFANEVEQIVDGKEGTLKVSEQDHNYLGNSTADSWSVKSTYWESLVDLSNFGESYEVLYSPNWYWLSSRTVEHNNTASAGYGLRAASSLLNKYTLFNSNGAEGYPGHRVRSVVLLPEEAVIDTKSTNGDTPETAYNIDWSKLPLTGSQLKVGEYVKYIPEGGSESYESTQEHNGDSNQTINRETLNWRVLSRDGNIVKIISDPTSRTVTYKGNDGYNNAVLDLNTMCSTLYSHGTQATARSVNLDDFTSKTQTTGSYTTSSSYNKFPTIYQYEKLESLGQSSQSTWYSGTYSNTSYSRNYWSGFLSSSDVLYSSVWYWLSSRFINSGSDFAAFYIVRASNSLGSTNVCNSYASESSYDERVRAVVSLPEDCTFGNEQGTIDDPYTIYWNNEADVGGNDKQDVNKEDVKEGDYVNYTPDENTDGYLSEQAHNGSGDQTINQENLKWRVLKVGTGDNDLEEGAIQLISDPTSTKITYSGAEGYNNAVKDLNDMCETLYSHDAIKARSVNVEDFTTSSIKNKFTQKNETYTPTNKTYPTIYQSEYEDSLGQSEQSQWYSGTYGGTAFKTNYWTGNIPSDNVLYNSKTYLLSSRCIWRRL